MPPWLLLWHDRRLQSAVIAFISVYLPIFFFGSYGYLPVILIIISTALLSYFAFGSQYLPYTSQAWILGLISSLSMAISATGSAQTVILCRYIHTFTLFHFTEFFFTGITNNENLKVDSFLLNHSLEYWVAAILSWFEFGIESLIAPWLVNSYISYLGLFICILGEFIRKLAMCQASNAFTHLIAYRRQKNHSLVTEGIYGLVRHPGYLGWALWSVGTQIILCNPFCFFAYAIVTFRFFEDRIYEEERYLVEFFGKKYLNYQENVPVGIPRIKGYRVPLSQQQ